MFRLYYKTKRGCPISFGHPFFIIISYFYTTKICQYGIYLLSLSHYNTALYMAKISYKDYNQGQNVLFPVSIDSKIPKNSPVRLVNYIVDELDLTNIDFGYKGGGTSSYHPRMMLKVLFYAYLNNVYSCRKISTQLEQNIHYMWLSGGQTPNFRTINNFRSLRLKDNIHKLFVQVVLMLADMNYISLQELYVDGTKKESKAGKYTFVWRKSVERHKGNLEKKIHNILSQIEDGIAQDNDPDDDSPTPYNSKELRERMAAINKENKDRQELKQIREIENKFIPKLEEYEQKLQILGNRNSYSKTDKDATFMRMKDDHMMNGQLKPAYNEQIGTENQFIIHYAFFQNPNDTLTFIPLLKSFQDNYKIFPNKVCADAGYGGEENYHFLESNNIDAYVKYNYYDKSQKKSFRNNPFLQQNLYYNKEKDYYVCPMGQHMERTRNINRMSNNGYSSEIAEYSAKNCNGCPLQGMCHKASGNRKIQVNHNLNRYKEKAREIINTEEGIRMMNRRAIEPESVFGQMKYNKSYNRFRHITLEKIKMDFAIFAIAFNILKLYKVKGSNPKITLNKQKNTLETHFMILLFNISVYYKKTQFEIRFIEKYAA